MCAQRINVTQGDFRKKKPETVGRSSKQNVQAAMQLMQLNKIEFTPEEAKAGGNIEFFGYIPAGEHSIEFYLFDDPKVKNGKLEMKYILGHGDLCAFKMKGGNQVMFAARPEGSEKFKIAAKAKIDGEEISFMESKAEPGKLTLALGKDKNMKEFACIL